MLRDFAESDLVMRQPVDTITNIDPQSGLQEEALLDRPLTSKKHTYFAEPVYMGYFRVILEAEARRL